ncbi:hypothetical protein [Marinovum sp.]|uniref:hypothetical protein n=1 Tax=Marinovum sp. TaxID=2024839 RepID=UPI002B27A1D8|nr:hypothetical protein [Marinovum sp.]
MTHAFELSLGLGACLLALAADRAAAQTTPNCAPRAAVIARLAEKYGESRQSMGLGGNNAMMELFASQDTGSWTITVTTANGITCLMAAGQAFETLSDPLPAKGNDA